MAMKTYKKGSSEKLSENFNVSEFACKGSGCCGSLILDEKLVEYLQQIRDHFGKEVQINSGYRCSTHNKRVGGVSGSLHMQGMAADISVKDVPPAEVAKFAESIGIRGIGLYESYKSGYFVHIDTRTVKSFWYGSEQVYRSTFGGAPKAETAPAATVSVKLPVLSKGDKSSSVKALQLLLIGNGYSCGRAGADGDFGSGTDSALRKYQKAKALAVDGKAGAEVWTSLLGM